MLGLRYPHENQHSDRTPSQSKDFVEISNIEKFDDGSGYRTMLNVNSGRFSCAGHPFYFNNLKKFTVNIRDAFDRVEGQARLTRTYEKDFLEVEVRKGGRVVVTGFVIEGGPPPQELHFSFECDQTFLPPFLTSLNQVNEILK
jgi:hypothetical protein